MSHEKWLIIRNNHIQRSQSNTIVCCCSQKRRSRSTIGPFGLWFIFFASGKWNNQMLCHYCSLKRVENAIFALILSTVVTFLSLEVWLRQIEGPVNVFLESYFSTTSLTWNSELFYPDCFISTLITNFVYLSVKTFSRRYLKYLRSIKEGNWLWLLFLFHCIDGYSCLG